MMRVKQTKEQISLFHRNTTAGSIQNSWLTTDHNLETKNEEVEQRLETASLKIWRQSRVYVWFLGYSEYFKHQLDWIANQLLWETVSYWIVVVAWNWQYNNSLISNWQL